jgi:MFS family permease
MLGSHITTIAYPLLVLRLTGSPFTAGCVAFAATAPGALAFVPAGALIDRWDPRRTMLLSELGRGLTIASVAAALALGKPVVALLIAVAVIEGVLEVFSQLAERRYVGSFVDSHEVTAAAVSMEARTHVVLVMGRPLGGLLFGIGPIFPFLADVFSFIYSVVTLTRVVDNKSCTKAVETPRKLMSGSGLVSEIRQGLNWIRRDKYACMAIVSFSAGTLIFQALIIVILGDAHDKHLSDFAVGIILAASGIGGGLGSMMTRRLLPRIDCTWIRIQTLTWFAGFGLIALPAGQNFLIMAVVMAILGFTGALGNIALDTYVMKNASQEILARVTSVGRLASYAAVAIGPVLGGVLVQELGVRQAMFCLFLCTPILVLGCALTSWTSTRQDRSQIEWDTHVSAGPPVHATFAHRSAVQAGPHEPVGEGRTIPSLRPTMASSGHEPLHWAGLGPWSGDGGQAVASVRDLAAPR